MLVSFKNTVRIQVVIEKKLSKNLFLIKENFQASLKQYSIVIHIINDKRYTPPPIIFKRNGTRTKMKNHMPDFPHPNIIYSKHDACLEIIGL